MIIEKNISKYVVFAEDSIVDALKKISNNKSRAVFAVSESGVLEGLLTDGDFRRWLVAQDTIDLSQPVCRILNKEFTSVSQDEDPKVIEEFMNDAIDMIPLLDRGGRLVAVARKTMAAIQIGDFIISDDSPAFVIAEIGINHNGSMALARKLIDQAVEAGADCAKFQMRNMKALYRNAGDANDSKEDLGAQYTLDLLSRFQLEPKDMFTLFDYCKEKKILPLCTPWDLESIRLLEDYGMFGYKVASADLTNLDLLKVLAKTGKPLLCSTGMSRESEIIQAVSVLRKNGAAYVLLHCNSTYPAPFKDINLEYLSRLKEIGDCPVGYSGHERGYSVVLAAIAKGAKVIEKHFTIDKTLEGNDHKVSLLPDEFRMMVQGIREVEAALGTNKERKLTQGELMNRSNLAKSLIINCALNPGDVIRAEMIEIKSPGRGVQPNRKAELVGLTAKRVFKSGDFVFESDLESHHVQPRAYRFHRPWGVPVRYHDYQAILAKTNPDFLEFHLSYKDMDEDIKRHFRESYDLDLVVHSPDMFPGDFLLNLASEDENHRRRSIDELQRVVEITRALKPYFKRATRPLIVASLGGYTTDGHIPSQDRLRLYDLLYKSLQEVDQEGVEIVAQTLPPFPWYFGGQLYLNLFVEAQDTAAFCRQTGSRLCFDISHSKLTCNHYKASFKEFTEMIGPYTAHLHIADADGVDGEGLQIHDGDIDFSALAGDLRRLAPQASFIPEIWQGHKNDGEGFWIALERLEEYF